MHEIDVEAEVKKYETELNDFLSRMRQLDNQRAELLQAIAERQGIVAYLRSLDQAKESE